MKIILLFDSINPNDKLANCYREYVLSNELSASFNAGRSIFLEFCHPDKGDEVFIAKLSKS